MRTAQKEEIRNMVRIRGEENGRGPLAFRSHGGTLSRDAMGLFLTTSFP